jgi:hypothetical protein
MRSTYIYEKSFRYRNGNESNRQVLVTSQNQNALRGFDITNMTPKQADNIRVAWTKVQNQNWSLTQKESKVLNSTPTAKGNFRSFKTSRIRYFHG